MTDQAAATAGKPEGAEGAKGNEEEGESKPAASAAVRFGPEGEKALEAFKKRAREAERALKEKEERLQRLEDENKSETEKALDKARKEARKEAESEFEKERRSDRLGIAVARHARDLADVDDVILNLQQGDTDDLFDDEGKVKADALKAALFDKGGLLERKPHLKAQGVGKPSGSADGGEGEGGGGKSFNDLLRGQ